MIDAANPRPRSPRQKSCSACDAPFLCGPGTGAGDGCWCNDLPPLTAVSASADCLCPGCLREAIGIQQTTAF